MILSIPNTKRIVLLFSIFLFLFSTQIHAQTAKGIDPNNLSAVKIDELNDAQVMSIVKQGEASGLTMEQAQAMAAKRGLPTSEVQKLKERIAKIQNEGVKSTNVAENPEATIADKVLEKAAESAAITGKIQDADDVTQGAKSTIYGQEYFRNGDIKIFDKSTDAKAPANYVIGIGDEFGISVFGNSYYNEVLKVDVRGAINPNQMGPIFIKGLTFEKAKSLIRAKMNQYFDLSNNKLDITLAYARSITINIVGEVVKPGSYKLPAINTAFNALILAGGPNDIGTLRMIQIRRNGKVVKTLDVYAFLTDPDSKQDFYLEDNDYIVVSGYKKIIKIVGNVKRPNSYELLNDEHLVKLLEYSGGLASNAYRDKVQIQRISNKEIILMDLNIDSLLKHKSDFKLQSGDILIVRPAVSEILNKVSIKGAIFFPGDYNFIKGQKIRDLIDFSGGLLPESNLSDAYLVRLKSDMSKEFYKINLKEVYTNVNSVQNILLQPMDEINIYSNRTFVEDFNVSIYGSVKKPASYTYLEGMTIGDLIKQAGGFKIDAENLRIEVARMNYFSENYVDGQNIRILLDKLKFNDSNNIFEDSTSNYKLQPFDAIYIRSVPDFQINRTVELIGEVKYPGTYSILSKDEKIVDLIKRAGGLNRFAFPEASTLYRPSLAGGYIVMNLKKAMKSNNDKYNFVLHEGDILTIPTVNDYVSIVGSSIEYLSVLNKSQVNAPFVAGRRAKYYINEFGNGFTKDSWRKKTYVVQPNAKVNRTHDLLLFNIYPKVTKGSTIYVVNKIKKDKELKKQKEPFNWNKFVENTTLKITGLATFYLIFKQITL